MAIDLIAVTPQQIAAGAVSVVPTVIAVCSALVAVLPPPNNQRTVYAFAWRIMDYVALNFGKGKTATKAVALGEVVPVPPLPEHDPFVVAPPVPPVLPPTA